MPGTLRLLVPALNEAKNLPRLLEELSPVLNSLGRPWTLLIIDDGSTDETDAVARRLAATYPIRIIAHARNLGPGAAFLTGFQVLVSEADDDDPIITLEADTTSDVGILPALLARFDQGADVVLASVYHPEGGLKHTSWERRLLSRVANSMIQQLFQMPGVYTFSSFYRVYRVRTLREALALYGRRIMLEPGFAAVVELLVRLYWLGARVEEVPMVLDSRKRVGTSRMRLMRTTRAYLRLMGRMRLEQAFFPPPPPA